MLGVIAIILGCILLIAGGAFSLLQHRIKAFEYKLILLFSQRSQIIPMIFEISQNHVLRHEEIFKESLELKKKEFHFLGMSQNLEAFIELETQLHHEINFIFQVCNTNRELLKKKEFLYVRDILIERSHIIAKKIQIYNKIIHIYNECIRFKNYTIIGYLLPFYKKQMI